MFWINDPLTPSFLFPLFITLKNNICVYLPFFIHTNMIMSNVIHKNSRLDYPLLFQDISSVVFVVFVVFVVAILLNDNYCSNDGCGVVVQIFPTIPTMKTTINLKIVDFFFVVISKDCNKNYEWGRKNINEMHSQDAMDKIVIQELHNRIRSIH